MQRNTGITQPITVEYGFLDNAADAQKLKDNYIDYAEAVVRAVLQYIGYTEGNENTYTVKSGDSLWSIAKKLNTSVEELKAANNLSSNLLQIGQVLKIPATTEVPTPGEYTVYTVKAGDSLYNIANRYNTTVKAITDYNNLSSTNLSIGQKLLIPTTTTGTEEGNYDTYTVKSGDSLYRLASQYNTSVDNLMRINNLSSNLLSIGQKLLVPKTGTNTNNVPNVGISYTVKPGDSLYKIANQYNTSVDAIKDFNNLTSNTLQIGQVIKIPTANAGITYVVKSGDNLYTIASKYNTTVDAIKRKNNLTSNILQIGQILMI